jgi:hypothetical protein
MIPGWLDELEGEVARALATEGSLSLPELAAALRVSEPCASSYVVLLASAGRLTIDRVSLTDHCRGERSLAVVPGHERARVEELSAA